jgi:predicted nucleic acid-binding protein
MSSIYKVSTIIPTKDDKYFFDANIWMHLFCSVGDYFESNVNAYNTFFQKVLEAGSKIYTTSMVISEFFNAYCRVEYGITKGNRSSSEYKYKQHFRKSEEFKDLTELLQNLVQKRILANSYRLNDDFDNMKIDLLFKEKKDFDFNDQYFIELCKEKLIKIVTHDKDFLEANDDIEIITNHRVPVHSSASVR